MHRERGEIVMHKDEEACVKGKLVHGERGETVMHKVEEACVKEREGSLCMERTGDGGRKW